MTALPDTHNRSWYVLAFWLLLSWTFSAADRSLTGPVVTWMINNNIGFMADAPGPYALGGLIGGLFFAGYMPTQFTGGSFGDPDGPQTTIVVIILLGGV